ncbi:hypothetical protein AAMO2058_001363400 [Amorphochlora amoebiformis]
MDFLKKGFASASKIVGSASGMMGLGEKTDKSLEDAQNKLRSLERMLARMRKSMLTLQKTGNNFGAADMLVTRDIGVFYKASKVRQKSITDYAYVHEELQKLASRTFSFQFDDIVTAVIDEWLHMSKATKSYLQRTSKMINKFKKSKGDLVKMKKQCQKLAREDRLTSELRDQLKAKEKQVEKLKEKAMEMKQQLQSLTTRLVDGRFTIFDECFVRLMEVQLNYFEEASRICGKLRPKIEGYRKRKKMVNLKPVQKIIGEIPADLLEDVEAPVPMDHPADKKERKRPATRPPRRPVDEDEDEDSDDGEGVDAPPPGAFSNSVSFAHNRNGSVSTAASDTKISVIESVGEPELPTVQITEEDQRALNQAKMSKQMGVAAFKGSNFEMAIKHFTAAINLMGFSDAKNYDSHRADEVLDFVCSCLSNRGMCYKQLYDHVRVIKDATLCINLKPNKSMIGKNLVRRGFAYEGMDKQQKALEDMLSARNTGFANAGVMQAISRLRKSASVPKNIKLYESRATAQTKSKPKIKPPTSNTLTPNAMHERRDSTAEAGLPSGLGNGGVSNILGFDLMGETVSPGVSPAVETSKPSSQPSWMNLADYDIDKDHILDDFDKNPKKPDTKRKPSSDFFNLGLGEDPEKEPEPEDKKPSVGSGIHVVSDFGEGEEEPVGHIKGDDLTGGPISQTRQLLMKLNDDQFWRFASDNLADNQFARLPRDKPTALKWIIHFGINNPSFYYNWETGIEEKKFKAALDNWEFRAGIRKDLMALLSGLHTLMELVPWKGRKWKRVGIGALQDYNQRQKFYKKAMLVVHPDRNGAASAAQQAICERAFDALTAASQKEKR